jgi:hypothetical protein
MIDGDDKFEVVANAEIEGEDNSRTGIQSARTEQESPSSPPTSVSTQSRKETTRGSTNILLKYISEPSMDEGAISTQWNAFLRGHCTYTMLGLRGPFWWLEVNIPLLPC